MSYLQRRTWVEQWYDTASFGGRFVRPDSRFRASLDQGGRLFALSGTLSSVCFMGLSVGVLVGPPSRSCRTGGGKQ
jgi:hypothetical protein